MKQNFYRIHKTENIVSMIFVVFPVLRSKPLGVSQFPLISFDISIVIQVPRSLTVPSSLVVHA